jgi:hypothetical protein
MEYLLIKPENGLESSPPFGIVQREYSNQLKENQKPPYKVTYILMSKKYMVEKNFSIFLSLRMNSLQED